MRRRRETTIGIAAIAALTMLVAPACTPQAAKDSQTDISVASAGAAPGNVAELVDRLSAIQPSAQGSRAAALVSQATAPAAESSQIETTPATDTSGPKPLDRVQYDSVDLGRMLPSADAVVPHVWNGWYVDHSIDAFRQAIDKNTPLVLVISEDWCKYCETLVRESLRCPTIDRFAGEAVFAISSPSRDRGASAIAYSLGIEAYPTITVLEPEARMLMERGRINGYFSGSKLGEHFETILWKTEQRVYVDEYGVARPPPPPPPRGSPLTTWTSPPDSAQTIATARSGATERGLKHASPEPKCQ